MKFQSIFLFIFVSIWNYSYAQQRTGSDRNPDLNRSSRPDYFIQFYSGKKINGAEITFSKNQLIINGRSYGRDSVKFFQNENGYFAHVTPISNIYAWRTIEGKVNLFEKSDRYYVANSGGYRANSFIYYCMGDTGPIRHPRFKYLKKDLSSNKVSLDYVYQRNEMTVLQVGCLLGGSALMAYGAVSGFTNKEHTVHRNGPDPFILSG